jgi:hypothetical protein
MGDHRKDLKNTGSRRFIGLILLFILFVWNKNVNALGSGYLTLLGQWALGVTGVMCLLFPKGNNYD